MKKEQTKNAETEVEAEVLTEEKQSEKPETSEEKKKDEKEIEEDIKLFHSLFPEVKNEDIPNEVWEMVEKGTSLSAAYSLYYVKEEKNKEKIEKLNKKNDISAPPKISDDGISSEYFSPEAVKKMSRKEIQKNYDAILNSMEKWN